MNVLLDSDYYPNQPQALLGEPALRKTAEWLDDLNHHPLIVRALSEIEESSTQHKYYHNLQHTLEVMADAIHFAVLEQCYDSEIELLALAAAFHDIGHSQDPAIHEEISAEYAQIRMRKFGYSATEMATVENLILDTKLYRSDDNRTVEQIATLPLSRYLLDADLANFGREHFMQKLGLVLAEYAKQPLVTLSMKQVHDFQQCTFRMLCTHKWQTDVGRSLLQRQKRFNMRKLELSISALGAMLQQ